MNPATSIRINKYLPFAILYFFFNSVFLPHGLLYTAILTPLFYWWSFINGRRNILVSFLLVIIPFAIAHYISGIDPKEYFISAVLLFTAWVFGFTTYTFLKKVEYPEKIFNTIAIINLIMVFIALIALFTPWRSYFWFINNITKFIEDFPRLALFTYESSYYATLLVPLVFFFLLKMIINKSKNSIQNFVVFIGIPLVLSFSLGVIAAITFSVLVLFLVHPKVFLLKKSVINSIFILLLLGLAAVIFLLIFYPDNILFFRLKNIYLGLDPSAKGRTTEAFNVAYHVADMRSLWWGVGLGQLQIVATEYIREYFNYNEVLVPTVRIPNAMAETLALFGFIGVFLRLGVQIFLFFRLKVWNNYFQLLLFTFMFIYQFTGSFIVSVAEIVIWVMAFTTVFPEFNRRQIKGI